MSEPKPPNLRDSDCCSTCYFSKLTDITSGVMPSLAILCSKHGNLVVRGGLVCDDYRG